MDRNRILGFLALGVGAIALFGRRLFGGATSSFQDDISMEVLKVRLKLTDKVLFLPTAVEFLIDVEFFNTNSLAAFATINSFTGRFSLGKRGAFIAPINSTSPFSLPVNQRVVHTFSSKSQLLDLVGNIKSIIEAKQLDTIYISGNVDYSVANVVNGSFEVEQDIVASFING